MTCVIANYTIMEYYLVLIICLQNTRTCCAVNRRLNLQELCEQNNQIRESNILAIINKSEQMGQQPANS